MSPKDMFVYIYIYMFCVCVCLINSTTLIITWKLKTFIANTFIVMSHQTVCLFTYMETFVINLEYRVILSNGERQHYMTEKLTCFVLQDRSPSGSVPWSGHSCRREMRLSLHRQHLQRVSCGKFRGQCTRSCRLPVSAHYRWNSRSILFDFHIVSFVHYDVIKLWWLQKIRKSKICVFFL